MFFLRWTSNPEGDAIRGWSEYKKAKQEAEDIAWHHRDTHRQELYLFKGNIIGEQGADGEDLFIDITPVKKIDANTSY